MAETEDSTLGGVQTTRRGLFGHAAGLYLAIGCVSTGVMSTSIQALWEKRTEIERDHQAACSAVDDAYERFKKQCPKRPKDCYVNCMSFNIHQPKSGWLNDLNYRGTKGLPRQYGTSRHWSEVATARRAKRDIASANSAERRALVAATYEEAIARLRVDSGLASAERESTRVGAALWELERRILALPAKDLSDLAIKAALVRYHDLSDHLDGDENDATRALLADIERMALSA